MLDVTFVRLRRSESELKGYQDRIRDKIEKELKTRGFNDTKKIYLMYYDGDATVCGGDPAVTTPGSVAAKYLRGRQGESNPCHSELAKSVDRPTLIEYGALHEIVHTLGFVATCAPNHTSEHQCPGPNGNKVTEGHVSDSPNDLMYAGCAAWNPIELDVGKNDYFRHRNPGCLDLENSVFLDPVPPQPPPGWSK
jgi:hypothetical protein